MHLDFLFQFALEASPKDFPLTRFEAISYRGNRTNVIRHRETDEFFIDKLGIRNFIKVVVKVCSRLNSDGSSGWT